MEDKSKERLLVFERLVSCFACYFFIEWLLTATHLDLYIFSLTVGLLLSLQRSRFHVKQ